MPDSSPSSPSTHERDRRMKRLFALTVAGAGATVALLLWALSGNKASPPSGAIPAGLPRPGDRSPGKD